MPRSDRLFRLLQALRTLPSPVTATRLAEATEVSVRSIYRDIESLRAAGATIDGERGYGYRIIDDGRLPPQMFTRLEIEALVLGLAEVKRMGDPALTDAATAVLGKVAATLPSLGQQHLFHAVSRVQSYGDRFPVLPDMQLIREACWQEQAISIEYTDQRGDVTTRQIWPLAVIYNHNALVLLAHCCLRDAFRMFRAERIGAVAATETSFRPQRAPLLRAYLAYLKSM